MEEVWKPIKGYEGRYEISNYGFARSCKRVITNKCGRKCILREKVLKPHYLPNGYLSVGLWKDGKKKDFYIHRLVASAFIPNDSDLPEVNHLDENKHNNYVQNLEWCTRIQNANHGTHNARMAATKRNQGGIRISQYSRNGKFIMVYKSIRDASRSVGVSATAIRDALLGKQKMSAGYCWKWYR